ncbi:hypothetical protein [Streptacidiphilus albus]|uniref:hypothetical protein n=1 Tax=Streptacidiphilus albus TaxID=105425 RepID=UPI00054C7840|nr:hypothetical protein [Streptacidiphilus albus]
MLSLKRAAAVGVVSFTAALIAAPAYANGGFNSYISGWGTGHNSRTWTEGNDTVATSVALSGCSASGAKFANVTLQLSQVHSLTPDTDEGHKVNYCRTSSWGRQSAADYRFAVVDINGSDYGLQVSAKGVSVQY